MSDAFDAQAFALEWVAAWNRRDIEAVLVHFHEDAHFTSPTAQRVGVASDGIVRGKAALRRYWTLGLEHNPNLHFKVTGVYQGINILVIAFTNEAGIERTEVLRFVDGLVIEGHGTFAVDQA